LPQPTTIVLALQAVQTAPIQAAASDALKVVTPTLTSLLIGYAFNFLVAIIILIVGWTLSVWARRWIRSAFLNLHMLDPSLGPVLASLAGYSIIALTVIAVLSRFGVEMTSLIAVIGAAGIAVGLALQGTLSNVASGLMILLLRPFRAGDMISILGSEGTRGIVREIGLFRTVVISVDSRLLSLPNSTVFSGTIVNYTTEDRFRVDITLPIDQVNDLGKVRRLFLEVAQRDDRIMKKPVPLVGVLELGEYSVTMLLRFWVDYALRNPVSWDIREALHDRMRQEGIAIAAPRQAVAERSERDVPRALTGRRSDTANPEATSLRSPRTN
jgi:small conductance mechanosensitive channel